MLQLWFFSNSVLWPFMVSVGGMKLGLNVVVLILAGAISLGSNLKIATATAKASLVMLAYLCFSSVVALTGPCGDHLQKSLLTIPVLLFLAIAGMEVGNRANFSDWIPLQRTALWALALALFGFVVEVLVPSWFPVQAGFRSEGKLSGLFREPSHVAFALFPCIAVLLVANRRRTRLLGMLALLGLLTFSRSSTLIALIVSWILYRLVAQKKVRQAALFTMGVATLFAIGVAIDYDRFVQPTVDRVVGVATPSQTENISSLVYVQGWQDAWFNLRRTRGMGLGLNMMGCGTLPDVSARSALTLLGLSDVNAEDGSFLFAKVVSEAGAFGIAFYIVAIWWWVQLERKIPHLREDATRFAVETQAALIFCFLASSFIRGSGYFEGGFLLWIASVSGASQCQSWVTHSISARALISPVKTRG